MTEARNLDAYDGAPAPELTLLPTGDEIECEDPLAGMHAMLGRVVVLDYTAAGQVGGRPLRKEVANSFIWRDKSERLNNGVYHISPRISLAPEQDA